MKEKALKEAKRIHDQLSQIDTIVSHVKRDWNEVFKLTFFTLRFLRSLRGTENLVNPVNTVNNILHTYSHCLSEHSVDLPAYGGSRYRATVQTLL